MSDDEQKTKKEESWLTSNKKPLLATLGIILAALIAETLLLRTLPVYQTFIGTLQLLKGLAMEFAVLASLSLVTLLIARYFKRELAWGLHYIFVGFICLLYFISILDDGLALDVRYGWVLNKAGFDILRLQYLNGWTIAFVFILTVLFLLSDIRFAYKTGKDGKRHLYTHSKVIGLVRILFTDHEKVGDGPDHPIIAKIKREEFQDIFLNPRFNDLVRVNSREFALWTAIKVLFGLGISSLIADFFALRFLTIQNYLANAGINWIELFQRYLSILWMRLGGTVNVPLDFAITNAPVFEAGQLFNDFLYVFALIWGIRLLLASLGEVATLAKTEEGIPIRNILVNLFAIGAIWEIPTIMAIPTKVFDATTPYYTWQTIFEFAGFVFVTWFLRYHVKPSTWDSPGKLFEWYTKGSHRLKLLKAAGVILLVVLVFSPTIIVAFTVEPYMQGRQEEYRWMPANLPSIEYTKWAYEVDSNSIQRVNASIIAATSGTEAFKSTLSQVRTFNKPAAKLNMKAYVGSSNWMAIDPSDADIIYKNNRELWVSVLTLVRPPYASDPDKWRTEHLILTHSEKVLGIDAASSKPINIAEVFNLSETPLIYYGEGGLWKDVDEVYPRNPKFSESHIPEYMGPKSYNDKPDYVYAGFWRAWKFYLMGRWDFARGDYGDIQALVDRDIHKRVSSVLLPGMKVDPDAQLAGDGIGNLYSVFWVYVSRDSPSDFADYREHKDTQIMRKFAVVTINNKNGELKGYLMDKTKDDYVLSIYRKFYAGWNKPVPSWLRQQLKYPEEFLNRQIDVYNFQFQDNFQKWQQNAFYETTLDDTGTPIEEVRYIKIPVNGRVTWSAERIVEAYQGQTRNLVGMYLAPGGEDIEKLYFVDFEGKTIIGPSLAISTVNGNSDLKNHFAFSKWEYGNALFYSLDQLYYFIPYYNRAESTLLPQMVAVVNAQDQTSGFYIIKNPKDFAEISMASAYALENLLLGAGVNETEAYIERPTVERVGTPFVLVVIRDGNETRIPLPLNATISIVAGEGAKANAT